MREDQSGHFDAPYYGIRQRPQRQDSLRDQLADLHILAARLGMYDAADWLWRRMDHAEQASLFADSET